VQPLKEGDLVVAYTGPEEDIRKNFYDRHGFGILIKIENIDGLSIKRYFVKFTKSGQVIPFLRDGIRKYE